MHCPDLPRITNLWSKVADGENGQWLTKVVIESTKPYACTAKKAGDGIVVEGKGVIVNMPEGTIEVCDGLLREIKIKQAGADAAAVEMLLDYPAGFSLKAVAGFPFRQEVAFDRSFIGGLFRGKKIAVDPGHGGKDTGGRGQVSLLEKDVVLLIARDLEKALRRAGAEVVLTRSGDEELAREERFDLARRAGVHVFISVHNKASADAAVDGLGTLYAPSSGSSARLARYVQEGMVKKLKAADRGIAEMPELDDLGGMPAIQVEVLAITNLVEEVFLRGLTVRKKAAEGILNGLIRFFVNGGDPRGDLA